MTPHLSALKTVYDVATTSPLQHTPQLSYQLGGTVHLKREDTQSVHSFKLRGAYNKIAQLRREEKQKGVIAASAGNHAQGVALAAQKLGLSALIIMPRTTPQIKVDAVKSFGGEVELVGDNFSEAFEACQQRIRETGRTFIHPFDDPLVIEGQGTIGHEILQQQPDVTHIFVPIGGGGLIAGVAQAVKASRPDVKIIGVEPEDSNCMQTAIQKGERVTLDHVGIFADGVAVKQAGEHTFPIARELVDDFLTVTVDQMCASIKNIFQDTRSIVEGAGSLAVAGVTEYAKTHDMENVHAVAICSGANLAFEKLNFIAERTLLGSGKEALFAVRLSEKAGALQNFCEHVVNGHSITAFHYRLNQRNAAHIFLGIGVSGEEDRQTFMDSMRQHDYEFSDLSGEDIAKEHTRYMIGGPAPAAENEHFYHINFPERPGALLDFLHTLDNRWNISLFHYRGQGGDTGRVLIGFEASDQQALEKILTRTDYHWENIDQARSIQIFECTK